MSLCLFFLFCHSVSNLDHTVSYLTTLFVRCSCRGGERKPGGGACRGLKKNPVTLNTVKYLFRRAPEPHKTTGYSKKLQRNILCDICTKQRFSLFSNSCAPLFVLWGCSCHFTPPLPVIETQAEGVTRRVGVARDVVIQLIGMAELRGLARCALQCGLSVVSPADRHQAVHVKTRPQISREAVVGFPDRCAHHHVLPLPESS